MRIGILGGSFNPVHNGHVKLVKYLSNSGLVDEVWVMPCKKHPLDKFLDKEEDRVAMVKLAISDMEKVRFCDFELKKDGKSYTYDTLRKLRQKYSHDFYWIMGSDILHQIKSWHGYNELKEEAKFIVFHRESYPLIEAEINIEAIIDFESDNISSTRVRERVRKNKSISDLVPRAVEDYILKNKLYC